MAPTKRAVVYILDASPSMNASFPSMSSSSGTTEAKATTTATATTTRWTSAKKALIRMIGNLMLQKKDNECSVMILKTRTTRHHLTMDIAPPTNDEDDAMQIVKQEDDLVVPYCHITEITPGIVKPTCHLLKQIEQGDFDNDDSYHNTNMEATAKTDDNDDSQYRYDSQQEADFLLPPQEGETANGGGGGDLAHGIILAMDALYKKTKRFKYDRSIVVLSDAVHQGMVDFQQLLFAIDVLRDDLQCPIYVMGMDFPPATSSSSSLLSAKFAPVAAPIPVSSSSSSLRMLLPGSKNDTIHQALYKGPQEWQSFFHLLLDKTGGQIHVVHDEESLQTLADTSFAGPSNCQVKEASGFKCDFRLAPGLSLPVKTFVLYARTGCTDPSIKQNKAFMMTTSSSRNRSGGESQSQQQMSQSQQQYSQSQFSQSQQVPRLNSLGQRMEVDVETVTKYVDLDENPDALMDVFQTTKAIRYSKYCPTDKLIAVDELQKNFLKTAGTKDGRTLEVLGYMPRCNVPMTLVMGPPVLVAGGNSSQKATAMITALARALFHLDLVAIVMYTKSKNGKPILGGLFPKDDEMMQSKNSNNNNGGYRPMHLLFSELPFAQDVTRVQSDWQEQASEAQDEQSQQQQVEDNKAAAACDSLIDALMLPEDDENKDDDDDDTGMTNNPVSISNPMAQSWKQTILQRVLDREAPIVDARCGTIQAKDDDAADDMMDIVDTDTDKKEKNDVPLLVDRMATPPDLLKQAESSLRAFYQAFPIKAVPTEAGKKKTAS